MLETLTVSNTYQNLSNVIVLTDSLLKELNLANNTRFSIIKHENGSIELVPIADYPKGDIRRLKGQVKTNITASIKDINESIVMGALYGE